MDVDEKLRKLAGRPYQCKICTNNYFQYLTRTATSPNAVNTPQSPHARPFREPAPSPHMVDMKGEAPLLGARTCMHPGGASGLRRGSQAGIALPPC